MRKRFAEPDEAGRLFGRSSEALTPAEQHTHLPRRAQALDERSKARSHAGQRDVALRDAEDAYRTFPDTKYETWLAYLRQHGAEGSGRGTNGFSDERSVSQ